MAGRPPAYRKLMSMGKRATANDATLSIEQAFSKLSEAPENADLFKAAKTGVDLDDDDESEVDLDEADGFGPAPSASEARTARRCL